MDRRQFVSGAALGLLAAPLAAEAQPARRVYRIGLLLLPSREQIAPFVDALEQTLRELGYVEGQNAIIERRSANGAPERLAAAAAELVALNVDVIVAGPNPVISAAKYATSNIPIVMVFGADPIGTGFIASLRRPGGNITGGAWDPSPDLYGKNLELLRAIFPQISRIALLWNPNFPGTGPYLKATEDAARQLNMKVQYYKIHERSEYDAAFASLVTGRAEAVVVFAEPLAFQHRRRIVDLATKHRLPATSLYSEFVHVGGLFSYGPNLTDYWRRAARYVDKILKGAKPADLPVEQPTKFELVINLKTAKALGLTIPPSLLERADEVIQ